MENADLRKRLGECSREKGNAEQVYGKQLKNIEGLKNISQHKNNYITRYTKEINECEKQKQYIDSKLDRKVNYIEQR